MVAKQIAVCDIQNKLAHSTFEFMQRIGFNEDGKTNMLEFDRQRSIEWHSTHDDRAEIVDLRASELLNYFYLISIYSTDAINFT